MPASPYESRFQGFDQELVMTGLASAAVAEFERRVIVERINAGLATAGDRGAKLGRPRTLDRHIDAVAKLSRKGLSGRRIAAELKTPAGSVFAVLKQARNGSGR